MKIYVRRRHIEVGRRDSCRSCPVALAIAEVIDGDPEVQPWYVKIGEKTINLPGSVNRFIGRFDSGKPVKPFAFTIKA